MTSKPRILCTGHSHLSAVLRAHRDNFRGDDWNFELDFLRFQAEAYKPNFVEDDAGGNVLNELIGRHMRHKSVRRPADAIVNFLFGNEVNAMALLRHNPPFDFHKPDDDAPVEKGAAIVPYGALRDMIGFRIEDRVTPFVREARSQYDGPIYVMPPPPPNPDAAHILANPGAFKDLAAKRGVAPPPLRRKMWRLYCDVLREKVEAAGAQILDPPKDAFDNEGYFRKDYWHWDPTHGNFAYGELVIRHILATLFALTPERGAS